MRKAVSRRSNASFLKMFLDLRVKLVADGIIRVSTTGGQIHEPWHGIDMLTKEPPPQTRFQDRSQIFTKV